MTGRIHPQMTVAEVIRAYPRAMFFFLEHRLHCVGCHLDTFCTLEQVAEFYGLPDLVQTLCAFLNCSEDEPVLQRFDPDD